MLARSNHFAIWSNLFHSSSIPWSVWLSVYLGPSPLTLSPRPSHVQWVQYRSTIHLRPCNPGLIKWFEPKCLLSPSSTYGLTCVQLESEFSRLRWSAWPTELDPSLNMGFGQVLVIFKTSYQELFTSKISETGLVEFLATTPSRSHYCQFPICYTISWIIHIVPNLQDLISFWR